MRPRPLATTEVMSHAGLGQAATVFILLWTIAKAVCWFRWREHRALPTRDRTARRLQRQPTGCH